jgi:GNAT superfamily N-acetyltransferase
MRKYVYFKRYRMEVDLRRPPPGIAGSEPIVRPAILPAGLNWIPWHGSLRDIHAEVKAHSFHDEMDATVFPCLGSPSGCRDLMAAITNKPGFCPGATWLVADPMTQPRDACDGTGGCVATIQGIVDDEGLGSIQNVGVLHDYRGRGIGRALVLKAIAGFVTAGIRRVYLEVTARNEAAVRMYRDLGFRSSRTLYRAVEVQEAVAVGS